MTKFLNKLLAFHQPGKPSKGARNPGRIPYTLDDMKRIGWCLDNKIGVSVIPNWDTAKMWMVQITVKGTIVAATAIYIAIIIILYVDILSKDSIVIIYYIYIYYIDKY